jgi:hypothetical protein
VRRRRLHRPPNAAARETRLIERAAGALDDDLSGGRLTGPADLHERAMRAMEEILAPGLLPSPHRLGIVIDRFVAMVSSGGVQMLRDRAVSRGSESLAAHRREIDGFESRLDDRWGECFDLLAIYRLWCYEAGETFHKRHAPAEGDWVYNVLVRLHARACLVTAEVLALLRGGFASGAHARWRSLHEISAVASFIAEHGQATAERYVRHEHVDSYRAAVSYQRYAERLGYEPFAAAEMDEMRDERDRLVAEYGTSYKDQYGWAAHALGHSPKFAEIEAAVSLDHLRPFYKMASHPTHAGPKGIAWDIGLLRRDVMPAGPSNAGMADPAHGTAISLLQITVALLNHDPDLGDLVTMQFILAACDAVGDAFITAHDQLAIDDARTVREAGSGNGTSANGDEPI